MVIVFGNHFVVNVEEKNASACESGDVEAIIIPVTAENMATASDSGVENRTCIF